MLRCEECGCVSKLGRGWIGYIAEDPDDGEGPDLHLLPALRPA